MATMALAREGQMAARDEQGPRPSRLRKLLRGSIASERHSKRRTVRRVASEKPLSNMAGEQASWAKSARAALGH